MSTGAWLAVIVGEIAFSIIILLWLSIRGTEPADRPKIIRALAELVRELFSGWRRPPAAG